MVDERITLPVGDDPPTGRLIYGVDVLAGLRLLPDNSAHCIVTSPPYWGLRDYGVAACVWGGDPSCAHEWSCETTVRKGGANGRDDMVHRLGLVDDKAPPTEYRRDASSTCTRCGAWCGQLGLEPTPTAYVKHMVDVFSEAHRVLRPDGTLWLNLGDSYNSGPPLSGGRVQAGTLKPKDLAGIPWRVALALQEAGWWLRNDVIWHKSNPMPSPVQDRFNTTHEHLFLLAKSEKYYFDLHAVRVPYTYGAYDDTGTFHPAQTWSDAAAGERKFDNTEGHYGALAMPPRKFGRGLFNPNGKNPGDMWTIPTQPFAGAHFAVWPEAIPERCIRAGTSAHGVCSTCETPWRRVAGNSWQASCSCAGATVQRAVVLDPFSGSGTTGRVAMRLGRDYVGLDLNESYIGMARARLRDEPVPEPPTPPAAGSALDLFAEDEL